MNVIERSFMQDPHNFFFQLMPVSVVALGSSMLLLGLSKAVLIDYAKQIDKYGDIKKDFSYLDALLSWNPAFFKLSLSVSKIINNPKYQENTRIVKWITRVKVFRYITLNAIILVVGNLIFLHLTTGFNNGQPLPHPID